MKIKLIISVLSVAVLAGCANIPGSITKSANIPARPEALKFQPFHVTIPVDEKSLRQLDGGNLLYIQEDHSLPLVQIGVTSKAGWYLTNDENLAVPYVLSSLLRDGGTRSMTPEQVDEKLAFISTNISFEIEDVSSGGYIDTLTSNLDESLNIFTQMLTESSFDKERLEVQKNKALERIKRRNDDTRTIEPRVWDRMIRGENFFTESMATAEQIKNISPEMLHQFTRQVFASGHLIFTVSGDVDTDSMVSKLNQLIAKLPTASKLPAIPDDISPIAPGLYGIKKDDVTQSRVSIGHPSVRLGSEDELAIKVMNYILGGGGFTSRITSRVRSDEGLAYSAGSYFSTPAFYDGQMRAYYQSKNGSVAYALKLVLDEINRIRQEPVTEKELDIAKQGVISSLGNIFSSAENNVKRFASDKLNHRDNQYWQTYEAKVNALTSDDILAAAKKYLKPEELRILVVGALDEVAKGDGTHGTLEEVAGLKLKRLPLRDPLTLKNLPLD